MNPSMRSALRRLGWGLVFPLFDLHFVFFDVLPDIIGYIIIFIALGQLRVSNGNFKQARWLAAALIFLSLPQLILKSSIGINELTVAPLGMHVYIHGTAILHCLLAYLIFGGLYTIARPIATSGLLNAIVSRRIFYVVIFASYLIFYPFLLNVEESWWMLLFFIGIIGIVAELLLIRLPFRLSRIRKMPIEHCDDTGAAPL